MKEWCRPRRVEVDAAVHVEEIALTFFVVNWEKPFQGPFFEVGKGLLDGMHSF